MDAPNTIRKKKQSAALIVAGMILFMGAPLLGLAATSSGVMSAFDAANSVDAAHKALLLTQGITRSMSVMLAAAVFSCAGLIVALAGLLKLLRATRVKTTR